MDAGGARARRHRRRWRRRTGARRSREDSRQGPAHRRHRVPRGRHARGIRQGIPYPRACRERALREQVPARVRSLAPADCEASRRDRARVRREVRGARLHRQGQRPGALRGIHHDARSVAGNHRPCSRVGSEDPSAGDGLGGGARGGSSHHQEVALFDRRQPVGPRHRVRCSGRPLERAAGGHLHDDHRPREGSRHPDRRGNLVQGRHPLRARRQGDELPRRHPRDEQDLRRERLRPPRHGGEPPRRREEPRMLRGSRRARHHQGAQGA